MAVSKGNQYRFRIGSTVLAYATASTINISVEVDKIAPTSLTDAEWQVIAPRRKNWSVAFNAYLGPDSNKDWHDLITAIENATSLSVDIYSSEVGDWTMAGDGYITAASGSFPVGEDATLRGTFTGSGALTQTVNS